MFIVIKNLVNNIICFTVILLLTGCQFEKSTDNFSGKFNGHWAETSWQFEFFPNNKFEFESEGHYGFVKSSGTYEKMQDSLFLMLSDSNLVRDKVVNSLYLIDGDSCIIDYNLKYDYCKTRDWSKQRKIKTSSE